MSAREFRGSDLDHRPIEDLVEDTSSPLAVEWLLVVIVAVLPLIGGIFMALEIVGAYFRRILDVVSQPFG